MPRNWTRVAALAMAGVIMIAVSAGAGDPTASLKQGNPQIKSAGPLGIRARRDPLRGRHPGRGPLRHRHRRPDAGRPRSAPVKVKDLACQGRRRCWAPTPSRS